MKKISHTIKSYLLPKPDRAVKREMDTLNIRTIHYVSLMAGVIQLISLVVFLIIHKGISDQSVVNTFIRVGSSVLLCLCGYLVSGRLMRRPDRIGDHPKAVRGFVNGFVILLLVWSMFASVNSYVHYQQLLTFYTVELLTVLFVKLHPVFTAVVILGSYTAYFLILNFGFIPGLINPYNYAMLALLSVLGAILNYHLTANYIDEKNKANLLNDSLEIIANHDSTTRLQNRYALNQRVPGYLDRDICVAMGDINNFKKVNDTYGHTAGDDVLKTFADILLKFFPNESVFRYGGDEFLIIEGGDDFDGLREKLRQVNRAFGEMRISNIQTGFSCSFGCMTAHPHNPSELFYVLSQADGLLYKEKENLPKR